MAKTRRIGPSSDHTARQAIADAKAGAGEKGYHRRLCARVKSFDKAQVTDFTGQVHVAGSGCKACFDEFQAYFGKRTGRID